MHQYGNLSHASHFSGQRGPVYTLLTTMTIIVTGGAGFIGSNFVLDWLKTNDEPVVKRVGAYC